jgi:hypothetical protein
LGYTLKNTLNKGQKLTSWSYQRGANMFLQSGLIIVPKYNLVSNIGLTNDSAHSLSTIKLIPKGLRRVYFIKTYNYNLPLKHPPFVINDIGYIKKVHRLMGFGHPVITFFRTIESVLYRIFYGDFRGLLKSLKRKFNR